MKRLLLISAVCALLAAVPVASNAVKIGEVFLGSGNYGTASQFVEIDLEGCANLSPIDYYLRYFPTMDSDVSTPLGSFNGNMSNCSVGSTWLFAAPNASGEFGIDVDTIWYSPPLDRRGGALCLDDLDCMSWGTNFSAVTPSPAGVAVATPNLDLSLVRTQDTDESYKDFVVASPTPKPFYGCGDGIAESPEECDDGVGNNGPSFPCLRNCILATCGDRRTCVANACTTGPGGGPEECDLGPNNGDTAPCNSACAVATCGDGLVCSGGGCTSGPTGGVEECDGDGMGTGGETATCNTDCSTAQCGDAVRNASAGEECDQGNSNSDTGACKSDCTAQVCGDGYVGPGESCDGGPSHTDPACTTSCTTITCGDSVTDAPAEECDDGNAINTDACVACTNATCGDGFVHTGVEECDDGASNSDTGACTLACTSAVCGDGKVRTGTEECDDGNDVDTDACRNDCTSATCGDGVVQDGVEECDDGGSNSDTGACTTSCTAAACGDGFVQAGVEECDDGDTQSGDGCSASCRRETSSRSTGSPEKKGCSAMPVTGLLGVLVPLVFVRRRRHRA